ncbi:MAG: MerR family transcriptional regulator [Clostridiales bacterium]|nr:MerR family transcriptional regulator [Clostridiales bacterium]
MEKYRAIPEGYMTVGELAKKMGTTVRTLQYYDKEGLLAPSAESEGGRRLYTDKDIFRLHQIQAMKYLDFSLDDIKVRLAGIDTPKQVAEILTEQAEAIRGKIAALSEVLGSIEKLKEETLLIKEVNFKKYADIIVNLQLKNDLYGLVKHMDDETLDYFHGRFDMESAKAIINTLNKVCEKSDDMQKNGIPPESEQGQAVGKEWWDMVVEFTGGNMALLPKLVEFADQKEGWDAQWKERWGNVETYLRAAMQAYFTNNGIDPLEGAQQK